MYENQLEGEGEMLQFIFKYLYTHTYIGHTAKWNVKQVVYKKHLVIPLLVSSVRTGGEVTLFLWHH